MKRHLPVIIGLGVVLVWFLYPRFISGTPEERGQFGDTYGGLNALFSGLAFTLLIYTVHLQSQELALQREELKMTREELARTAKANEETAKSMREQASNQLLAARISGEGYRLASFEAEISEKSNVSSYSYHLEMREALTNRDACRESLEKLLKIATDSSPK